MDTSSNPRANEMHFKITIPCLVTCHNTTATPDIKDSAFPIQVTTSEPVQKVFQRNGMVEMYWPFATAKSGVNQSQMRVDFVHLDVTEYQEFAVKHMV